MPKTIFQKQIIKTLIGMEKNIESLRNDFSNLMSYIEDTKLTEEEKKQLDKSISKIKSGDASDFVSWKDSKKELGI